MKKTYIAPEMSFYRFEHLNLLFSASGGSVSLTNGGESSGGMSGDSREFSWDEEEDY